MPVQVLRGERSSRRHLRRHCVLVAVQVSNLLLNRVYFHEREIATSLTNVRSSQ